MSELEVAWAAAAAFGICGLGQAVAHGSTVLAAISLAGTAIALFLTATHRKDNQ